MKALITFEGIEGCGKTTQIRMAGEYLGNQKIPSIITEEPGGSPLGKKIREILLNQEPYLIGARAELLLFSAARAQHVQEVICPPCRPESWFYVTVFPMLPWLTRVSAEPFNIDFIKL